MSNFLNDSNILMNDSRETFSERFVFQIMKTFISTSHMIGDWASFWNHIFQKFTEKNQYNDQNNMQSLIFRVNSIINIIFCFLGQLYDEYPIIHLNFSQEGALEPIRLVIAENMRWNKYRQQIFQRRIKGTTKINILKHLWNEIDQILLDLIFLMDNISVFRKIIF
jgi:hypothetical protein